IRAPPGERSGVAVVSNRPSTGQTGPAARFGIVGSGWRTQFFLRLARMAPAHFAVTGVVTRSAERGAQVEAEWDVPTFRSLPDLVAAERPEFVLPSVPWSITPQTTKEAVEL